MLKTTIELIGYLNQNKQSRDSNIVNSLVSAVLKCGGKDDADEILIQFLKNPYDYDYSYLFPVLIKFGDNSYAEKIFNVFIKQNKLAENDNPEILEVLAHLKYYPIK